MANGNTEGTEEGKSEDANEEGGKEDENSSTVIGPVLKKTNESTDGRSATTSKTAMQGPTKNEASPSGNDLPDVQVGAGGAWGMGAAPGSVLAKLIEEQEKQQQRGSNHDNQYTEPMHDPNSDSSPRKGREYHGNNSAPSYYGNNSGGGDSGYKDNQSSPQNDHQYGSWNKKYNSQQSDDSRHNGGDRNSRYQNFGAYNDRHSQNQSNNGDWNNRNNNDRDRGGHHQGSWNDNGRNNYRGVNRSRRNDGDYGEGKGRNRGGNNNYGDRGGGYQRRKRGRDDYNDRYSRR